MCKIVLQEWGTFHTALKNSEKQKRSYKEEDLRKRSSVVKVFPAKLNAAQ
jgi:hypothetical protein